MFGWLGTISPPLNEYTHPPDVLHHTDFGNGKLHPGRAEFFKEQSDDEFAERFNQIELTLTQFFPNALNDLRIVNRIRDIVMFGSRIGHTKGQIQLQRLLGNPLPRIYAHSGLDPQCFNKNEIHRPSRLKSRPF
mgnify:CR=1 FL=1